MILSDLILGLSDKDSGAIWVPSQFIFNIYTLLPTFLARVWRPEEGIECPPALHVCLFF